MPVVLILQPKLSFTNYKGKVQIDCPNDCQQTQITTSQICKMMQLNFKVQKNLYQPSLTSVNRGTNISKQ